MEGDYMDEQVEMLLAKIELKKEFMTTYLDGAEGPNSAAYYEAWLDALDTFETWIKQIKEEKLQ